MSDGTPDNTSVSSVDVLTGFPFNKTFVLSSIIIEPTVFVGNGEADLIREKELATTIHCPPMMCHWTIHPGLLMSLCETRF